MFGSSLADVSPLEPNLNNSLSFVYYRWLIEDINAAEAALRDMEEFVQFTELNRNTLHRPRRTAKRKVNTRSILLNRYLPTGLQAVANHEDPSIEDINSARCSCAFLALTSDESCIVGDEEGHKFRNILGLAILLQGIRRALHRESRCNQGS